MGDLFVGSALCEVTLGGELVLPLVFHAAAKHRLESGGLYIGLHEESPCLIIYGSAFAAQQHLENEARRVVSMSNSLDAYYTRLRRAFGCVELVELAADGMMRLSALMRQRCKIGQTALLVATGSRLEIWDLDEVLARRPPEVIALAMLHLEQQLHEGISHEPVLPSSRPQAGARNLPKSGVRLHPLPKVRPRYDPVCSLPIT